MLEVRVLIGEAYASEGNDPPFPYFFEVVKDHHLAIRTDYVDHLLDLLTSVLLSHAFQDEGEVIVCQNTVFVYVDHLERLANFLIRVQLTVYLVACGFGGVGILMRYAFLLFLTGRFRLRGTWKVGQSVLRSVDFDGIEDLLLALGLIHEALMRHDTRDARKRLEILKVIPGHM